MTCMTALAQTMAMPTTQLTRVFQYEDAASWQLEENTERKPLRMRWVVVTDDDGKRQLRMRWELATKTDVPSRTATVTFS